VRLPWRVRLRLRRDRLIDHAASWLLDRGHEKQAVLLWRMFGLW
jgi:hypothetical protein